MLLAKNPEVLSADGSVNMSANGAPLMIPADITTALNAASAGGASTSGSTSQTSSGSASSASTTPTTGTTTNGARSTFVSTGLLSVAVFAVSILVL